MNKYLKFVFAFFFLAIFVGGFIKYSFAEEYRPADVDPCSPEELIYAKTSHIWDLDIRRTVDNMIISIFVTLFANVSGLNPDAVMGCQGYLYQRLAGALGGNSDLSDLAQSAECSGTPELTCAELVSDTDNSSISYSDSVEVRAVRSSLLGFSNLMEGTVRKEPLPINLAYYWDQSISKIPYVNKALAANPSEAYKNMPMIAAVYGLWSVVVKMALGIMSAIVLFTGIMIVMRKKVNQQLVVSVQYAIPKIIISAFLIIFSYPIGALIASVSWGLFRGAFPLVFNAVLDVAPGTDFPTGILYLSLITFTLTLSQGGFFYMLLVLVVAVLLFVLRVIVFFKAFLIYIKMVFSIMTAPLEFALGAVPGSENRTKDWFIRMAKYALTIFGMGVAIPVSLVFGVSVIINYASALGGEGGGWGILIMILTPLIVVVLGFGIALNMDKHVNAMFGEKVKKK